MVEQGLLASLGLKASTLVAGLFGAIASLMLLREVSPLRGLLMVVVGTAASVYLSPVVLTYAQLEVSREIENAVAFLSGTFGMAVIAALMRILETVKRNPDKILEALLDLSRRGK